MQDEPGLWNVRGKDKMGFLPNQSEQAAFQAQACCPGPAGDEASCKMQKIFLWLA